MNARYIEAWGTFDVANTGDLLYPLVLEHELRARVEDEDTVVLGFAAPIGGAMPLGDGRSVRRITDVDDPAFATQARADGLVLGGGDILRAGPEPAADFIPDTPGLYRYDAFIGELAVLASAVPLAWNGVGVPLPFDDDGSSAVRVLAERARYVSVRDETSRRHLEAAGVETDIAVVPDPAFLIDRVFARPDIDAAIDSLRRRGAYPQAGPVLAFHASFTSGADEDALAAALRTLAARRPGLHVALVPLGPCHGDVARMQRMATAIGPAAIAVDGDLRVVDLVAAIAGADAFVGSSLHGNVIAARYGVPGAFVALKSHQPHKLIAYSDMLGRAPVLVDDATHLPSSATALLDGRVPVDTNLTTRLGAAVTSHYDRLVHALATTVPIAQRRALLTKTAAGLDEVIAPARAARAAADTMLAGHVRRLTAELHAAGDANDRLRRRVDELDDAPPVPPVPQRAMRDVAARIAAMNEPDGMGGRMIAFDRIRAALLHSAPYHWGIVDGLYEAADRRALIDTFPTDPYATITGHDGEKGYQYEARCLVAMGGVAPWRPDRLSEPWFRFATDLCSRGYRDALAALTGRSLEGLVIEANAFHYGPGSWLGPHVDLPEKILTHVLYFNDSWDVRAGGSLRVLRSGDEHDFVAEVPPIGGSSIVLVRSDRSWHAVTRVAPGCKETRRSVTVTFYAPGSVSTMWPPGEPRDLHAYPANA